MLLALAMVSIATADDLTDPEPISLECLIEPQRSVVVSASVIGVVSQIDVERGDHVEAGQLVAALDSRVEAAAVELARARASGEAELKGSKARVDFEKRRLQRGKELRKKGVMAEGELDEIESAVLLAAANVMQAEENRTLTALELVRAQAALDLRTIRSPVDGVVVELMLSEGEYADPPQVMEIAQIDPLRVEVYAPVSLLGKFELGMKGRVMLEGQAGGRSYDAEVVIVDGVVDAASGTFGVRLELPNPEKEVLAGLSCRVEFAAAGQ